MPIIMLVNIFRGTGVVNEPLTDISQGAYYLAIYISVFMLSL
ncbi:hypothetical protein DSOL_2782 [Desulfosporosinus metallidurans]|uniref:Uncharacterized protein n=1 Tax=Desulfosporosinus metallidurans TaxID=1888891 RepID=A0A1Q8QV47_9FIRM|nr:hypothetical protein DSOL_2782 [Desulfosporosinus metallidurans]